MKIENGYYSITVTNHQLITIIKFVMKVTPTREEILQIDFI